MIAATHVHGFPVAANNQEPGYDPFFLNRYCFYEGVPLLPVNTDPLPTPVP